MNGEGLSGCVCEVVFYNLMGRRGEKRELKGMEMERKERERERKGEGGRERERGGSRDRKREGVERSRERGRYM